jgi:hypothetical protein
MDVAAEAVNPSAIKAVAIRLVAVSTAIRILLTRDIVRSFFWLSSPPGSGNAVLARAIPTWRNDFLSS